MPQTVRRRVGTRAIALAFIAAAVTPFAATSVGATSGTGEQVAAGTVEHLLQLAAPALGTGFAGAWLDADGRTATIAFSRGSLDEARANPALSALAAQPGVRLIEKTWSQSRLDATLDAVASRLNAMLADGTTTPVGTWPFTAWVDSDDNVLRVVVSATQVTRAAEIEGALAPYLESGIATLEYGVVDQTAKCVSRNDCTPYRGGIALQSPLGGCSSGFVFRNFVGVKHMLTASHCGGGVHNHNGARLGSTGWNQNAGNVDGQLLLLDNPDRASSPNWVFRPGNAASAITSKISTPGAGLVGNFLCSEGAAGGSRCGSLLSHNSTWQGRGGFGLIDNTACPGDSGGAIVNNSTNRAYGIITGGPAGCAGPNHFTWTSNAEVASGTSLLLNSETESLGLSQTLFPDQRIVSSNGSYVAVMQGDGNFVIYAPGGVPIWSTGTNGYHGSVARMQSDGNFVIYRPGNVPIWWTGTNGRGGARITIQTDANLVIYTGGNVAVWASGTNR